MTSSRIANEAQTGFADASTYDAHRPSYPAEAVSQLLTALKVADLNGATIADLAAGTGKFTELMVTRPEKYRIVAIEPHLGMRQQLENKKLTGLTVLDGTGEDMSEIADESFDALIVAQVGHVTSDTRSLAALTAIGFSLVCQQESSSRDLPCSETNG